MSVEIQVESLIGKRVRDATGKSIGRIEEIRAEQQEQQWVVTEYLVGRYGLYERLSAWFIVRSLLQGLGGIEAGVRIPWDQLDLGDPSHPRLRS